MRRKINSIIDKHSLTRSHDAVREIKKHHDFFVRRFHATAIMEPILVSVDIGLRDTLVADPTYRSFI
jgi:hypothetical protein